MFCNLTQSLHSLKLVTLSLYTRLYPSELCDSTKQLDRDNICVVVSSAF